MTRPLTWLDVFTSKPLKGNQLAVVHDADGISDATMLAFARETRLSETTFVQTATEPGADYRNRIWTQRGELPFAGHPSLGTAVAVARARGEEKASFVQQTPAGLQPVDVQFDGDVARASMLQEPPQFGVEPAVVDVMSAAGLMPVDAHPLLKPQVVSTGVAHVIAPLTDAAALARVLPNRARMQALLAPLRAVVLYLAVVDVNTSSARVRGLFLDPHGVTEDPATGSAAGPLLAYLNKRAAIEALTVNQGDAIGRPSRIDCVWEDDRPRVSGDVVVVADGQVAL